MDISPQIFINGTFKVGDSYVIQTDLSMFVGAGVYGAIGASASAVLNLATHGQEFNFVVFYY